MSDTPVIFPPQFTQAAYNQDPTLIWRKALQLEAQLAEARAIIALLLNQDIGPFIQNASHHRADGSYLECDTVEACVICTTRRFMSGGKP